MIFGQVDTTIGKQQPRINYKLPNVFFVFLDCKRNQMRISSAMFGTTIALKVENFGRTWRRKFEKV